MVNRNISPICLNCDGRCCKAIDLIIRPAPKMKELIGIHYGRDPETIETIQIGLHHICPHLQDDGLCALWDEDPEKDRRPEYCQEYLCEKAQNPGVVIVEAWAK